MIRSESFGIEYLEQFYITVSLLLLECNSDENIRLQLDMIGELQDLATHGDSLRLRLSNADKFGLHATAISLLSTLSFVVRIPDIFEYKDKLVSLRKQLVPHLLPPLEEDYSPDIDPEAHIEAALIDLEPVKVALREAGRYTERGGRGHNVKTSRGSSPAPGLQTPRGSSPRISWTDRDSGVARRPSCISVSSVTVDVDSCASSPGIRRRPAVTEFSFAEMKRALAEPTQREKEEAERTRRAMLERFQTASFSELCEMSAASRPAHTETLYQCLSDIYSKVVSSAQCLRIIFIYLQSTWNASVGSSSRKSSITSCSYDTTDVHTAAPRRSCVIDRNLKVDSGLAATKSDVVSSNIIRFW